jgi:hypothetical protein
VRLALLVVFCLIIIGCAQMPDYSLDYGFGPCNKRIGWVDISLDKRGIAKVTIQELWQGQEKTYRLSKPQLKNIAEVISLTDFFSLHQDFINENVVGGTCSLLRIEFEGRQNEVRIANTPVPDAILIQEALVKELQMLDRNWHRLE